MVIPFYNDIEAYKEKMMANKESLAERKKREYLELNKLTESELTDQDLENIKFNIEYAKGGK